jgi:hypothetical protein
MKAVVANASTSYATGLEVRCVLDPACLLILLLASGKWPVTRAKPESVAPHVLDAFLRVPGFSASGD